MASTFSTNLHLELQGTGDNSGTWGTVLNNNALAVVDQAMGGVQSLSLSSSNVTVTTNQSQNNAFLLTGTLTADINITWPAIGRTYYIANNTTGAHTVTLRCGTPGATVQIEQGSAGFYTLNVNDVYQEVLLHLLKSNATAQISAGFTLAPNNLGTITSGTVTPAAANGNYQYLTNNGAFTLAAPAADCAIDIMITNGASAGTVTFSGYTVGAATGSQLTTANGSRFIISIRRIAGISTYSSYALQ